METVRDQDPLGFYDDDLEEALIRSAESFVEETQRKENKLIDGFDKEYIDREIA